MMKWRFLIGIVMLLVTAYPTASRADVLARVVTVHEGDRLTVYYDGRKETLFLKDVDCPDLKQPFGKQAKVATAAYVGNREVVIRALKRNKQGRTTAEVALQDGRIVAHELIKEGLAWSRPETVEGRKLAEVEELARAERKGIWSDPNPVPPWKWSAGQKAGRKFSN
jgi:micrococcal nuclease